MLSISSQQKPSYSKQDIKINGMASKHDLPVLFLDYSSNNLPPTQTILASLPDNYSKAYTQGLNPSFNNFHSDSSSQFHSTSSNFSYSNSPKIAPPTITHQAIQTSIFSSRQHKTKWTYDEDARLKDAVDKFGTDSWIRISQFVPGRNSKQCRERWMGQLAPTIRKDSWSREEDEVLIHQHDLIGNKWTTIATFLPGRSAINVKNRWSKIKRFKDDFLVGTASKTSTNTHDFNNQYFDNNDSNHSTNSNYSENSSHKKNISSYNKRSNHKSGKFKHSKYSNSISKRQQKGRKNDNNLDSVPDEITNTSELSQAQNNDNIIKEKLPGIVFEFPTIDNVPLFGQDFAQFQAQMLK